MGPYFVDSLGVDGCYFAGFVDGLSDGGGLPVAGCGLV